MMKRKIKRTHIDEFDDDIPTESRTPKQSEKYHQLRRKMKRNIYEYNTALKKGDKDKQRYYRKIITQYEERINQEMIKW